IKANLGGAAQPQANAQVLGSFLVPLPARLLQEKIAAILSAFDDLIENNTRRLQILEQMVQMLYREWFIQFRFPGCEIRLVESQVGPIPQGWSILTLNEVVDEIIDYRGKTPKKLNGEWASSGIVALSALNVKKGCLVNLESA